MRRSHSSKNKYRSDIDGIRALAVLSVFFFHLQPNLLPGGFLGVDVFFVISGYLITGIILRENHLQKFSFIHFYARRIKRIFPALFAVLLLSAIVATFLLSPDTYINFMKSARYASCQLANFFFSREVGYFEEGFSSQPLLHTWSLGVEEQFYLFWPFLIYLSFRLFNKPETAHNSPTGPAPLNRSAGEISFAGGQVAGSSTARGINKKIGGVMLLLSLISFTVCYSLADTNYNLAFYMFYTRVAEFCIGGVLSLKILPVPETKGLNNLIGMLGFFLLCYSFLFIKEEYSGLSFLQFGVLLPCIGAALIIHANAKKSLVNKALATAVPARIGKISYSLYLYHWPLIIFWKIYSNTEEISIYHSLAIIALAFVLSILSYLFIEQPARKSQWSDWRVITLAGAVIVIFAISFANLEDSDTSSWRITSYINETLPPPRAYSASCRKKKVVDGYYYKCTDSSDSKTPIVALIGDSHAPPFLYATTAWAEKSGYDVELYALAACPLMPGDIRIKSPFGKQHDKDCRRQASELRTRIVDDPRVKIVLLAHRFDLFYTGLAYSNRIKEMISFTDKDGQKVKDHTGYYRSHLEGTLDALRDKGKELIILKQVPIFDGSKDCDWEPRIKKLFGKKRVCSYDNAFISKWQKPSMDFIDEFAASHKAAVLDLVPFFDAPLHDGINLYKDSDHLNGYGSKFIAPYFVRAMDKIMAGEKKNSLK
jgi:peptidoglycan/LPS O-acetylase OafA/YrhL